MKIFITGATGFIGGRLAQQLAEDGHQLHALIRSPHKTAHLQHTNIRLFKGELLDKKSIATAIAGCEAAFHLAAYAKTWSRNPSLFHKINVDGTVNVFEAAKQAGLQRVVFTSTGGTLNPSDNGQPSGEETPRTEPYFNDYESTKAEAEEKARAFTREGLPVITVNPTRVYGPGLIGESAAMTKIIRLYSRGRWRIIPGDGTKYGNYVFIDDVANAHVLALHNGTPGERYIAGGENATYDDFFDKLKKVSGKNYAMLHMHYPLLRIATYIQYGALRLVGKPPLITPEWIKKYLHHWAVSSRKAQQELGYEITPLETGITKTLKEIKTPDKKRRNDKNEPAKHK
jgi:farnesol dehydrogenase